MFLRVHGCGVWLRGPSRCGKSSLALELVARGHQLVADDAIDWRRGADGCVSGSCPPLLAGFLEVDGLGVLNLRALYGAAALAATASLDLVLELGQSGPAGAEERLHGRRGTCEVLGVAIDRIGLPAGGQHTAALVEAACRDYRLRQSGYRADDDLIQRQRARLAAEPAAAEPGGAPAA